MKKWSRFHMSALLLAILILCVVMLWLTQPA